MRAGKARWLGVALWLSASGAWANGAFPDSLSIHVPADPPGAIYATTNFGLLISLDGGARFSWVCEEAFGLGASLFQLGPPPESRLYAVSPEGLAFGSAGACGWSRATGALEGASVTDVFVDPNRADRVLAIARPQLDAGLGPDGVYPSDDAGRTFGPPLFVADDKVSILSVEIARSDPQTIYLALARAEPSVLSSLARSRDGGATWQPVPLASPAAGRYARLAAVDPDDADRLYLRLSDPFGKEPDQLGISDDGGGSVRIAHTLPGAMSAFLRRANGTLLVATAAQGSFRSVDDGATFQPWPGAPHLRGLAERGGRLYAVTDNYADGYAVGASDDETTWVGLTRFNQLCGVLDCPDTGALCGPGFQGLSSRFQIPATACGGLPDAGPTPAGPEPSAPPKGCGCGADQTPALFALWGAGLVVWRRRWGRGT